ncbi:hypothetical protein KKF34_20090 [Myxococcota bacterium]|nr:hypothetical protein [Myxococcota bacterium]MBU1380832.1 hypothetical protein [Myxococcota bacterium]MBU1499190.1 hypothetical protein [Myxococcota bacterium]
MSQIKTESLFFPGKVILFGEHSILYGSHGLSVPVSSGIYLKSKSSTTFKVFLNGKSIESNADIRNAITILETHGCRPAEIEIISHIPPGAGLGFSAALSAGFASMCLKKNPEISELNGLSFEFEKIFHGRPSGLDNATVVYNSGIIYTSTPHELCVAGDLKKISANFYLFDFRLPPNLALAVSFSGNTSLTKEMIEKVRKHPPDKLSLFTKKINALMENFLVFYQSLDFINMGKCLTDAHYELAATGISTPHLDLLVDSALNAGALGAKLTGKGGGGCVVALIPEKNLTDLGISWGKAGAVLVSPLKHSP